jgi:2-dehydro-3-deoxygluconokinase
MDVVTIGESMVLMVPETTGPLRHVDRFRRMIGGAESNVAIGLSRLGQKAGWISRVGQDEFGRYLHHFIRGEGVDTSRVVFDADAPTGVMFKEQQVGRESKVFYYRKDSAASRLSPHDLDPAYIGSARYLHLTGITPALSPSCRETVFQAIRLAREQAVTLSFDPNIRLRLWSPEEARDVLRTIVSQVDVVLPGLDEGKLLTGESEPEAIATHLLEHGPSLVVVKLGAQGAYFATQDHSGTIPGVPVEQVVDPVGAGDAFAAGFLSGQLRGWTLEKSVRLANRAGASALTVKGDVEGLPYWSDLQEDDPIYR